MASASSSSSTANLDGLMRRVMLERIEEEERNRVRPLEDPYLVGEEAAARARAERIARENRGDEVLIREDRRWDWFLGELKDYLLFFRFTGLASFCPPLPGSMTMSIGYLADRS